MDIDLTDLRFWGRPPEERLAAFAELRKLDAPAYFTERHVPLLRPGGGFHALVRHADVVEASRNAKVFSSEPAATSPEPPPWVPALFGRPMVNMDDPRHARLRKIVSRAFTPRRLTAIDDQIRRSVDKIVTETARRGSGEFVSEVAARLPVEVICAMVGIPEDHHSYVLGRVDTMTEYSGVRGEMHRLATMRLLAGNVRAIVELHRLVARLGRERLNNPGDDILSALVTADVDGERLTLRELGSFFDLLLVAGNETTRNTLAHALLLFTEYPEQREELVADFDGRLGPAVEEVVRFATPIIQFRRTLRSDYELRGHPLREGEKVVLYYVSANRDEEAFVDPDTFDISRRPNQHVGFGGGGPHMCLGAHLARRELTAMLRELYTRLPGLRAEGEPAYLLSSFDNGITRLRYAS